MKRYAFLSLATLALAMPTLVRAEGGEGSLQAAGGGHMSSYVSDPYHNPKSLHSQRMGTGQISGSPMLHDEHRARVSPGDIVAPHWASGMAPRPIHR